MQRYELDAWLGDAADDLTSEQIDRLMAEADRIADRYPDPDDEADRQAALSAAVQYLLGDTRPTDAGHHLNAARRAQAEAMAASQQIATMAVADGMTKSGAARAAAIDRMTLLKALGER